MKTYEISFEREVGLFESITTAAKDGLCEDCTQINVESENTAEVINQLLAGFKTFIKENNYSRVNVLSVKEVPYDQKAQDAVMDAWKYGLAAETRRMLKEDSSQDKAVIEVFLWDGVTEIVKCTGPEIKARVVVHNCDEDYSSKKEYEEAIGSPTLKDIEWTTDSYETNSEEEAKPV